MNSKDDAETKARSFGPLFADRLDAGRQLGEELRLRGHADDPTVVIAIPRGGVPVGYAVARALGSALQIIIPRKLPDPDDPEVTLGAITPDGTMVLNLPTVQRRQLTPHEIKQVAMSTLAEVRRQMRAYLDSIPPLDLDGKTAILVDDGCSSGFTMLAAVRALRRHRPTRIVAAVPVSPVGSLDRLAPQVDELICLAERDDEAFVVANSYECFDDLTDEQVRAFLIKAQAEA
jgi:putative phosphoribosyl transferase